MISGTTEEFRIILYLIGYGIFCISSYDTIMFFIKTIKKIIKVMISIGYFSFMILFTYEFSYKLAHGYIPVHFILFLITGFLIYYLIRRRYLEGLEYIKGISLQSNRVAKKILIFLVYPKEIISIIMGIIKTIKRTICKFLEAKRKKNKKME